MEEIWQQWWFLLRFLKFKYFHHYDLQLFARSVDSMRISLQKDETQCLVTTSLILNNLCMLTSKSPYDTCQFRSNHIFGITTKLITFLSQIKSSPKQTQSLITQPRLYAVHTLVVVTIRRRRRKRKSLASMEEQHINQLVFKTALQKWVFLKGFVLVL